MSDNLEQPEKTATPPPKLLDQVRDRLRLKHYSLRTEQAYVGWGIGVRLNAIKLSPNPLNQNKISASSTRLVSCEEQILMQITDVAHEASIGAARLDVLGTSFQ